MVSAPAPPMLRVTVSVLVLMAVTRMTSSTAELPLPFSTATTSPAANRVPSLTSTWVFTESTAAALWNPHNCRSSSSIFSMRGEWVALFRFGALVVITSSGVMSGSSSAISSPTMRTSTASEIIWFTERVTAGIVGFLVRA